MGSNDNPWGGSYGAANSPTPKLSTRVSEKLGRSKEVASAGVEKTKVVASVGFQKSKVAAKKVKQGASVGVNWIKLKYSNAKLFQNK